MTTPWYRQFWPWFLISLPATAVAGCAVTIWLALASPNALVVDDYSRIALSTEARLERDRAATELGVRAALQLVPAAGITHLRIWPPGVAPERLSLRFVHPTLAERDRRVELLRTPDGWSGEVGDLGRDRWYVQLESGDGRWRLAGVLEGETELALEPALPR